MCSCPRGDRVENFISPLGFLLLSFLLCSLCPELPPSPSCCICFPLHFVLTSPLFISSYLSFCLPHIFPHPSITCQAVTLLSTLGFKLLTAILFTSTNPFAQLPPPSFSSIFCLQPTFAMKRCSCARMEERASRTRSVCVLQSSKGYCANSPAVRRGRTAMAPLRRTSAQSHCCSALC